MATSKYNDDGSKNLDPVLVSYFVFTLPNGEVLDMCSGDQVQLPEGNLSNLPMRRVEKVFYRPDLKHRLGFNPRETRVPELAPIVPDDPLDHLESLSDLSDHLEHLSDEAMEQLLFGNVQPR